MSPNLSLLRHYTTRPGRDFQPVRQAHGETSATTSGTAQPYLRPTRPTQPYIQTLLADPQTADQVLARFASPRPSPDEAEVLSRLFGQALAQCLGQSASAAYDFALRAWRRASGNRQHPLFARISTHEDTLVHIMINRGDWDAYSAYVAPIPRPGVLWARTAMETFRFSMNNGCLTTKAASASSHALIALYATKCLLHSPSPDIALIFSDVLRFLQHLGRTKTPASSVAENSARYRRVLALLAAENLTEIERRCAVAGCTSDFPQWMTLMGQASADNNPQAALACWDHKVSMAAEKLVPDDLAFAMRAHVRLRQYDQALALYNAHLALQHDMHIVVLLSISERTRDWRLLQQQFEDMYGRGDLPREVHYAMVMSALASLGAADEVGKLYAQYLGRGFAPLLPVLKALVQANVNGNVPEAAAKWFDVGVQLATEQKLPKETPVVLRLETLKLALGLLNMLRAQAEFEQIVALQRSTGATFIDEAVVKLLLDAATSTYAVAFFERVWAVASELELLSEPVYHAGIVFHNRLGNFPRANALIHEAHLNSPVPFQSCLILAAELNHLREWLKQSKDRRARRQLALRIAEIVDRAQYTSLGPKNIGHLYAEVVAHHVAGTRLADARLAIQRAKDAGAIHERHYLPLLEHYATQDTFEANSDVLAIYREMVLLRLPLSARTYRFLLRSLLKINSSRDHASSHKLLESVFEMYGFLLDGLNPRQVASTEVAENAVALIQLVAEYAVYSADKLSMHVLVDFLKQLRSRLDKRIDVRLRITILAEMAKVYKAHDNTEAALALTDNALQELDHLMENVPDADTLPKPLQLDYGRFVATKLQILKMTAAPLEQYEQVLGDVLRRNVRLSGNQFYELMKHCSARALEPVLEVCERFLVVGNWAEATVGKKLAQLYRLYIVYLGQGMSVGSIAEQYRILNEYYSVDIDRTLAEFDYRRGDVSYLIKKELAAFTRIRPQEDWDLELFLERPVEFFVPERLLGTANYVRPEMAVKLLAWVEAHCGGDQTAAFGLYDKYPETIEYLLYFLGDQFRVERFRRQATELLERASPDRATRRAQVIEALQAEPLS